MIDDLKPERACNKFFNTAVILALFLLLSACSLVNEELVGSVGFIVICLVLLAAALIFMPYCYQFDEYGVSFKFLFFQDERYLWKNVRSIKITNDTSSVDLFNYLFLVFELNGRVEGRRRFYMTSQIYITRKTKRLLKKYWNGNIQYFDDMNTKFENRLFKRISK